MQSNPNFYFTKTGDLSSSFAIHNSYLIASQGDKGDLFYQCLANEEGQNNYFISGDSNCWGARNLGPIGYIYNNTLGPFSNPLYRCDKTVTFKNKVGNEQFEWPVVINYVSLDQNCEGGTNTDDEIFGYVLLDYNTCQRI